MNIAVAGFDGPLSRAVRAELQLRGHSVVDAKSGWHMDAAIFLPGDLGELQALAARPDLPRLVVRSHAYAYGSNPKNPGHMDESRISLLPPGDPAQRWLRAEEAAAAHPNWAAIRLTNVTDPGEGDLIIRKLSASIATRPAGRDANLQFIGLADAARALVAAAESSAPGIFNAACPGAVPLKEAFKAAGTRGIGLPETGELKQFAFNWHVSGDRAERELGFRPQQTTVEALREFLAKKPGANPGLLKDRYDDWGLGVDYIRAWGWWFAFLRNIYWRIEHEGMENIPATGKALFVSNHRGFMPLDAVMHLSLIFTHRQRVPRFLIIHSLLRMPFLSNFLTKLGGVVASQENADRLLDQGELIGIFPEGIRGTFSPLKTTYRLRNFSKSGFVRMAIEHQVPIIPCAVIGHAEIFPIVGRIDSGFVVKELGWPYLPIAPPFPLAPVPLPSKWHVRILPPVPVDQFGPSDLENDRLMKNFSDYIQHIVQANLDDMLPRRKSIFRGREVLNGKPPAVEPFTPSRRSLHRAPADSGNPPA